VQQQKTFNLLVFKNEMPRKPPGQNGWITAAAAIDRFQYAAPAFGTLAAAALIAIMLFVIPSHTQSTLTPN
jgi:hypothetical protein